MKKEIAELLEKDEATLHINSMFYLNRWQLHKETDIMGRDGEYLELTMKKSIRPSIIIESRDLHGIIQEVSAGMEKMLDEYKEELVKKWENGYINEMS